MHRTIRVLSTSGLPLLVVLTPAVAHALTGAGAFLVTRSRAACSTGHGRLAARRG